METETKQAFTAVDYQDEKTDNILMSANAMQNCLKADTDNGWYARHEERIHNTLLSVLPHGSGIDCKWSFNITDRAILCTNAYHVMNENGMYIDWVGFTVKIKTGHRCIDSQLDISITGKFSERKHQDVKEYLYEIIPDSLSSL